jgi:hypothetical protein
VVEKVQVPQEFPKEMCRDRGAKKAKCCHIGRGKASGGIHQGRVKSRELMLQTLKGCENVRPFVAL